MRVGGLDRLEGVAADQLGEAIGLVRGRHADGPHFVQGDADAALGQRPGGLAAGEAAPYDSGEWGRSMLRPYGATGSAGVSSWTVTS